MIWELKYVWRCSCKHQFRVRMRSTIQRFRRWELKIKSSYVYSSSYKIYRTIVRNKSIIKNHYWNETHRSSIERNGFEKSRSCINWIYLNEDPIAEIQRSILPYLTKYLISELRSQKIAKKKKLSPFLPSFFECGITIYLASEVRNVSHPRLVSLPCIFLNIINETGSLELFCI